MKIVTAEFVNPVRVEPLARLMAASKHYGKTLALDAVDLEVHAGEVLALLGPNGAGKTTAISLLLGLLQADAGSVHFSFTGFRCHFSPLPDSKFVQ